ALVDQQGPFTWLEGSAHGSPRLAHASRAGPAARLPRLGDQGSCVGSGRDPSVTSIVDRDPSAATTVTGTVWFGWRRSSTEPRSSELAIACPSIATITSPCLMPACAAGPSLVVAIT